MMDINHDLYGLFEECQLIFELNTNIRGHRARNDFIYVRGN